jgi:glycosyltransferase A (GT-A) superfamily protein (DUF2064 family)
MSTETAPGIAIFVKTPGLSPIKTRLATAIGEPAALRFYDYASAAVASVVRTAGTSLIPYWAVAEADALNHERWSGFPTLWQGEGGLGARMYCVYSELLTRHGSGILIGADSPQMRSELLFQAAEFLQSRAAAFAIGRSVDGGFWIFAGREPVPLHIWESVGYSQADTASAFEQALSRIGGFTQLPMLIDADHVEDLPTMMRALQSLPASTLQQRMLEQWLLESGF